MSMGREPSEAVVELAQQIHEVLKQHPGEAYTYAMIGESLQVDHQKTNFRLALAEARRKAAEDGACITACVWDRRVGARALRYLGSPEKTSPTSLVLAHSRRAKAALTEYATVEGDDPLYGMMVAHAAEATSAVEQLALAALEAVKLSRMQAEKIRRQQREIDTLRRMVRVGGIVPASQAAG